MQTMFSGDHVVTHMSNLFDGQSQTRSVSADEQVKMTVSVQSHDPPSHTLFSASIGCTCQLSRWVILRKCPV